LSETENVFQLIRHGIVIKIVEGNYYYIGGKSNYWAGGKSFAAVQGMTEFFNNAEDSFFEEVRKTGSNVVIIRVKEKTVPGGWVNPSPPQGCSEPVVGWILDAMESNESGVLVMNYVPFFTILSDYDKEVPGGLVYESGGKLSADGLLVRLRATSNSPPLPYPGAMSKALPSPLALNVRSARVILATPGDPLVRLCQALFSGTNYAKYCDYLNTFTSYNEIVAGAPVFSSFACPSGCKDLGLAGLVYGGEAVSLGSLQAVELYMIEPPSPTPGGQYTDQAMRDYATKLGVLDLLDLSDRFVKSAMKAESQLVATFGISPVVASAIIVAVTWHEDWQKTFEEAKKYGEMARNVVQRIKNELIQFGRRDLLSFVDDCVAETFSPDISETDWYYLAQQCVFEHRTPPRYQVY
jgi:hypothetical protein